jgi:hypothetical protein
MARISLRDRFQVSCDEHQSDAIPSRLSLLELPYELHQYLVISPCPSPGPQQDIQLLARYDGAGGAAQLANLLEEADGS